MTIRTMIMTIRNVWLFFPLTFITAYGTVQGKVYSEHNIAQQTALLIGYYETLFSQGFIGTESLQKLASSQELINPITQQEADVSLASFTHYHQLTSLITSEIGSSFDVGMIQSWSNKKLDELGIHTSHKQEIYKETKELYRPMSFVPLRAGEYIHPLTGKKFTLQDGLEIQETPMTQYQWALLTDQNPSTECDAADYEEINLHGNVMRIRPNAPADSILLEDVDNLVDTLNNKNDGYVYGLPSMSEFLAVLIMGRKNGNQAIHNLEDVLPLEQPTIFSRNVVSGGFITIDGKRVFGLTNSVGQLTRDYHSSGQDFSRIIFGRTFLCDSKTVTCFEDLLKPLHYRNSACSNVGVRLIRFKKMDHDIILYNYPMLKPSSYNAQDFTWSYGNRETDSPWKWEPQDKTYVHAQENLRWMLEHRSRYEKDVQQSLDVMQKDSGRYSADDIADFFRGASFFHASDAVFQNVLPISGFQRLENLSLEGNAIADIQPLAGLKELRTLDLEDNKITEVKSLRNCKKLRTLYLSNNHLSSLDGIGDLIKLEALFLSQNTLETIRPLESLVNLRELYVSKNKIFSLEGIEKLTRLKAFAASENRISDIAPLEFLYDCRYIDLNNNALTSLSRLQGLIGLVSLYVANNALKKLDGLEKLKKLTRLDISGNAVSDIEPLAHLDKLAVLDISNANLTSLELLTPLKELTYLAAHNNGINTIRSLNSLENLVTLSLQKNCIEDVSSLSLSELRRLDLGFNKLSESLFVNSLPKLQNLNLTHNAIQSLYTRHSNSLESLDISHNALHDLTDLKNLTKVTFLDISCNGIKDLLGIAGMRNLRTLKATQNNLASLSEIENLYELKHLDVGTNSLKSVAEVKKLIKLEELDISHNKINDFRFLKDLRALEKLTLFGNPVSFVSLRHLPQLKEVVIDEHQAKSLPLKKMFRESVKITLVTDK